MPAARAKGGPLAQAALLSDVICSLVCKACRGRPLRGVGYG